MIDFYIEQSPAVFKAAIALEEGGFDYRCTHVAVADGAQHAAGFRAISPNGKIPAIVDHAAADGGAPLAVFESGAILLYLAEKAGRFLPAESRARSQALQWLFWQSSGLGPFSGQAMHFLRYAPAEAKPYGRLRYLGEVRRHWGVLDTHLAGREWIANDYSVADMGAYPWIALHDQLRVGLDDLPHLARWLQAMAARPAVQRAYARIPREREDRPVDPETFRRAMFGAAADHMAPPAPRG